MQVVGGGLSTCLCDAISGSHLFGYSYNTELPGRLGRECDSSRFLSLERLGTNVAEVPALSRGRFRPRIARLFPQTT